MADSSATRESLVDAARRLGPLIQESIGQGERERRLPATTARALREAGFFRLCRPRRLGGLEADPLTVLEVVEEIARHDGSAAWCALNCGIAGMLQSFLPPEGAREIGSSPDVVLNGVIAPTGRATEVDGGYRVTGRWSFASNCDHCGWLAPSCIVYRGGAMSEGPAGPEIVVTWVESPDFQIIDNWDAAGLRATGSHDVEVAGVFVPRSRTFLMPPSEPRVGGALFRFPVVALWAAGMASAALGLARAAIDEVLRLAGTKTPFGMTSKLATRPTSQIAVCEALAGACSARALLVEETARMWALVQAPTPVTSEQRARLRIAATHATATSASVVDRMYTVAGGTALLSSSPLQRCLRDVHAITQHLFVAPPSYEMLGKILLGVEPDGFLL